MSEIISFNNDFVRIIITKSVFLTNIIKKGFNKS